MKKAAIWMTLVAVVGLANANMLTNGDFEDGTAGWSKWWDSGNAGFPVEDPLEGDQCGGVWWSDCGIVQTVPIGPGVYEFGGKMLHGAGTADPLGQGRVAFIQAEVKGADGTVWWVQNFRIDSTSPTNEWITGTGDGIIDNREAGASQITINLFSYDQNGAHTGTGVVRFDDIFLAPYGSTKAYAPNPADGATVPTDTDMLSWTNPDPNDPADTITSDIWLGAGDPNNMVLIAAGITDEFVTLSALTPPVALADNMLYYWQVDCTDPHADPNTGGPVTTVGDLWTFDTGDAAPVADAGPDQYVWVEDGTVTFTLSGAYLDDGDSAVSTLWEVVSQDPAAATIEIADPTALETQVTIDSPGWYQFRLNVDDALWHDQDELNVGVYSSACEAAMADPADEPLVGDLDGDCDTDLEDFAILAASWLECMSDKLGCTP